MFRERRLEAQVVDCALHYIFPKDTSRTNRSAQNKNVNGKAVFGRV